MTGFYFRLNPMGEEKSSDLTLRESDIWVFNCNGSLYFVRTNSYDDAEKKCRAAQIKDGVKDPVVGVGHKILVWE
jgi:hypothetical protein